MRSVRLVYSVYRVFAQPSCHNSTIIFIEVFLCAMYLLCGRLIAQLISKLTVGFDGQSPWNKETDGTAKNDINSCLYVAFFGGILYAGVTKVQRAAYPDMLMLTRFLLCFHGRALNLHSSVEISRLPFDYIQLHLHLPLTATWTLSPSSFFTDNTIPIFWSERGEI